VLFRSANFNIGLVETYTTGFAGVTPPGSFTDPNLPVGYAPFNIQPIGNQVFVTYAVQNSAKHDPVKTAGNGIVSVFNLDGTFVKRFASNGVLNAPWGVVQASANFGAFSNDILIGNFGDGTINAFDANGNSLVRTPSACAKVPSQMHGAPISPRDQCLHGRPRRSAQEPRGRDEGNSRRRKRPELIFFSWIRM